MVSYGLGCSSFPSTLITGHSDIKRPSKESYVSGYTLPCLACGVAVRFSLYNQDQSPQAAQLLLSLPVD